MVICLFSFLQCLPQFERMALKLGLKFLTVLLSLFALQIGVSWYVVQSRHVLKQPSRMLQMLPENTFAKSGGGKGDKAILAKGLGMADMISQLEKSDHARQSIVSLRLVHTTTAKSQAKHTETSRLEVPVNILTKATSAFDGDAKPSHPQIQAAVSHKPLPHNPSNTMSTHKGSTRQAKLYSNATKMPSPALESQKATGTWEKGTFCDEFLTKTFRLKVPMCSANSSKSGHLESIECFGNPHSTSMGTCTLRNLAVSPGVMMQIMYDPDRPKFENNKPPISLLRGRGSECREMTFENLVSRVEGGDYIFKAIKSIVVAHTMENTSVCKKWINETTFFFTAHRFHAYFRFLDYYNVHKLLGDMKSSISAVPRIIRISGSDNYHFPEFDQALFPEAKVQALEDIQDLKTCFREVILVPKSYASPIFQCKSRISLKMKCGECNGLGLNKTEIRKFRNRVLRACSSRGLLPSKAVGQKLIVLVSRKPYLRNQNDKIDHFERVLENEEELAQALRKAFVNATVRVVHLENLTICEQVTYGHHADVYVGVHGSGLVHLWWMRGDALLYEMEPHYQIGNPTFRQLSYLLGRNYHRESVGGGFKKVHANVESVVQNIKKYSSL